MATANTTVRLNDLRLNVSLVKGSELRCVVCRRRLGLENALILYDGRLAFAHAPDALFVYCSGAHLVEDNSFVEDEIGGENALPRALE